jgi:hypothetical protein
MYVSIYTILERRAPLLGLKSFTPSKRLHYSVLRVVLKFDQSASQCPTNNHANIACMYSILESITNGFIACSLGLFSFSRPIMSACTENLNGHLCRICLVP